MFMIPLNSSSEHFAKALLRHFEAYFTIAFMPQRGKSNYNWGTSVVPSTCLMRVIDLPLFYCCAVSTLTRWVRVRSWRSLPYLQLPTRLLVHKNSYRVVCQSILFASLSSYANNYSMHQNCPWVAKASLPLGGRHMFWARYFIESVVSYHIGVGQCCHHR